MTGGDVLEELYAAEPDSFVEVRKRLVRELRAEGRADDAAELAALRKPAVPVFLANRLARERPLQVKKLVNDATRLAGAQRRGDPTAVRKAQAELKDSVGSLLGEAAALNGKPLSDDVQRRLTSTLRAAAVDPALSGLLRRGVLADELEPSGFQALAGVQIEPAKKPAKGAPGGRTKTADARPESEADRRRRQREAERRARIDRLEVELAEAGGTLRDAERALAIATREAERVRERVAALQSRIERERAR
jgi:hypothetical protein